MPLRYSKVSIPEPLFEQVRDLVDEHPELGYRSPTDAATQAIRKWIEDQEERIMRRRELQKEMK